MEDYETMGISDKRKYFQTVIRRHHRSGKEKKGRILDEFWAVFELSRGYLSRFSWKRTFS